jgi:hypothetical protein
MDSLGSLLLQIPHRRVVTDVENVDLYQLGYFEGKQYELVEFEGPKYYPPRI